MYLGAAIESSGKEEIVLPEPTGMILPKVVLRIEGQAERRENWAVNPHAEVSERPYKRYSLTNPERLSIMILTAKDGCYDMTRPELRIVFME